MTTIHRTGPARVQDLLDATAARLSLASTTPILDAQVLLAHVLERPRTWVLAHPAEALDPANLRLLEGLIQRLEGREPLPYVLGHWEFFGLDFDLTPDVLIPRPETEMLVERVIAWLQAHPGRRSLADIGTGSACIAVSVASQVADLHVLATDISAAALAVGRRNAAKFKLDDRIEFVECDLLPAEVFSTLDVICANLPYIPTATLQHLPVFGREPTLALDGGPDGLDPFRKLFNTAPQWLAADGQLFLEIEATRGMRVLSLAFDAFANADIHLRQDLTGRDRLLEIRLSAR